jgi:hypothetical protein
MTGNRHNHEGQSGEHGEPGPGPYWQGVVARIGLKIGYSGTDY